MSSGMKKDNIGQSCSPFYLRLVFPSTVDHQWRTRRPHCNALCSDSQHFRRNVAFICILVVILAGNSNRPKRWRFFENFWKCSNQRHLSADGEMTCFIERIGSFIGQLFRFVHSFVKIKKNRTSFQLFTKIDQRHLLSKRRTKRWIATKIAEIANETILIETLATLNRMRI